MKAKPTLLTLVVLALAVMTAAVATAAPAAAYSREYQLATAASWTTGSYFCVANGTPYNHSAVGCFAPNGDYIQPGDLKADGKRVGVQWKTSYGRYGLCVNKYGKDATFTPEVGSSPAQGKHECNKNFKEGSSVSFRAGTCDASVHDCSVIGNWSEWTPWITRKANA